jgi:hypothetical protein
MTSYLVPELVNRRVNVIVFVGAGINSVPESPWQELRASQIPTMR